MDHVGSRARFAPLVPPAARPRTRRSVLRAAGALAAPLLAAPGFAVPRAAAQGADLTIQVTDAPGDDAIDAEKELYAGLVERFEQANPGVTIDSNPGGYGGPEAFAAKVAGGTLEDAFAVWFTEPQRIISQGIAADITDNLAAWAPSSSFVPEVLSVVSSPEGRVFGIPVSAYALSLVYNRRLFTDAGLDPNAPPTTWEDLRTAAKQIADQTGTPGFSFLSIQNQGGWHFTTMLYTFGADPFRREGDRLIATFNDANGVRALQLLKDMRWTDGSMTEQQQLDQAGNAELLATGQVAMAIGGVPAELVQTYEADLNDYGLGGVPQGGGNAVLGGGYAWMFNAESTPEQRQAAIDWVLFRYFDPENYAAGLDFQAGQDQPVGFPEPPLFTGEPQAERDALLAEKANVPTELYAPYIAAMQTIVVKAEPTGIDVQRYYGAIDPAVQAILTDEGADPRALLDEAAARVQAEVLDPA